MEALIVDALGTGRGGRIATVDAVGAGPRAVAGVLERHGIEPRLATAAQVLSDGSFLQGVDLLFISAMTVDLPSARRIVRLWRRREERGPVVVGGPLASSPYDAVVRVGASLAVVGEGEKTLEELMELGLGEGVLPSCEELRGVRGVAFSEDGRLVVNPLRPVMPRVEYDSFTPSTRVIVDYPFYFAARVYVEALRGAATTVGRGSPSPTGEGALAARGVLRGG
ncbi:cobalamin-dependent protein [Candidatus Bathyarchaeota archaeon]|nr:cobalamin-dependent protein [Candidatus Bathyarchaeota archaeon]